MAEIRLEPKRDNSVLPWLVGFVLLVLGLGWLVWRSSRAAPAEGRREQPQRGAVPAVARAGAVPARAMRQIPVYARGTGPVSPPSYAGEVGPVTLGAEASAGEAATGTAARSASATSATPEGPDPWRFGALPAPEGEIEEGTPGPDRAAPEAPAAPEEPATPAQGREREPV